MKIATLILEVYREGSGIRFSSSTTPHLHDDYASANYQEILLGIGCMLNEVYNSLEQVNPTGKDKETAFGEFLPILFAGMSIDVMASVGEPAVCFTELRP